MELKFEMLSWKVLAEDDGTKKIAGSYCIKSGTHTVAEKDFNDGYGSIKVTFPAALIAKIEALTKEVQTELTKYFD